MQISTLGAMLKPILRSFCVIDLLTISYLFGLRTSMWDRIKIPDASHAVNKVRD